MLNIIQNNPYRFLGVCSNAPTAERLANSRKLGAFLKVNKEIDFRLDIPHLLPSIQRTIEGLSIANKSINLPKDQLKYSLFWFTNVTSIDKMALDYLQNGNTNKAIELLNKKETYSSLINIGILSFIKGDDGLAIQCISKVIHEEKYRNALIESICGPSFQISEGEMAKLFIESLLEEMNVGEVMALFEKYGSYSGDNDFLRELSINEPMNSINSAIAQAKGTDRNDAQAQYEAGVLLMNSTKDSLALLEEYLFTSEYVMEDVAMLDIGLPIQIPRKVYDPKYNFIADKLAKQILQCGINYYNNADEDEYEEIEKALTLQEYALSIAVGKLTKDRCRENIDILIKKREDLPPKEVSYYVKLINDVLEEYIKKPKLISSAIDLIKKSAPYLMSIKEVLGAENAFYLKTSTIVVNASLNRVIEVYNRVMEDNIDDKSSLFSERNYKGLSKVMDVCREAWNATLYMDQLDMDPEFKRNRYDKNRSALDNQIEQFDMSSIFIRMSEHEKLVLKGETAIFESCRTKTSCNNYLRLFPCGKYASQVKERLEKFEFDSCKTTKDCDKFIQKYPKTKFPIIDKKEECYFNACDTIILLEGYIKEYPKGKFLNAARLKIDKLSFEESSTIENYENYITKFPKGKFVTEAKEKIESLHFSKCNSINDYKAYIEKYPKGRYIFKAYEIIDKMSFEGCKIVSHYQQYMKDFPSGKYRAMAWQIINDEQMWETCVNSDSKDMYKQYLAKFPNGRHKSEAEQKASACYIATMVYGDYNHPQVIALRDFRDKKLQTSSLGRAFVGFYYRNSPSWVEKMQGKKTINNIIRFVLNNFIKLQKMDYKKVIFSLLILLFATAMLAENTDSIKLVRLEQSLQNEIKARENLKLEIANNFNEIMEQVRRIDSLETAVDLNAKNIKTTAEQIGIKIDETNSSLKTKANTSDLKSKTILGSIFLFFIVIIGGVVYYLLHRRINKRGTEVDILKAKAVKLNEDILNQFSLEMSEIQKISSTLVSLSKTISSSTDSTGGEPDHSLIKTIADRITFMEMTLYRMDASVKGHKPLSKSIKQMKDNLLANGYEIVDMLGKPYNDGMKVTANFIEDEELEEGQKIITAVIKPQINYKGKMIQAANITVSQN